MRRIAFRAAVSLGWVLSTVMVLMPVRPVQAGATPAKGAPVWDLASDFRISPDQGNPNPGPPANKPMWYFMQGSSLLDPAGFTLLPEFITDALNVQGLEQWQGTFVSGGQTDK